MVIVKSCQDSFEIFLRWLRFYFGEGVAPEVYNCVKAFVRLFDANLNAFAAVSTISDAFKDVESFK